MRLILSPHLDDAVLSCPVYIQRSREICIATVFTNGAPALYRARRAEDRRACRFLGARPIQIGLLDAPYRSGRYSDFIGIVFNNARERDLQLVTRAIGRLIEKLNPSEVAAPLGAGNHIDHRLVRDAAVQTVDPQRLLLYEDRPYALIDEQVAHVLGRSLTACSDDFWERYFETTYLKNYMAGADRAEIIRRWQSVPCFPRTLERDREAIPNSSELRKGTTAIRMYKTQITDIFASRRELEEAYRNRPEFMYRLADR